MLDRLIALLLLWAMEACFAWGLAQEYSSFVNEKLSIVLRVLNAH